MNIIIIGYGKMGKEIEVLARERGHAVTGIFDINTPSEMTAEALRKGDAAIEFTRPDACLNNYNACFEAGIPLVSGTTGWNAHLPEVIENCHQHNATFFYAPNFSIGVNLFFRMAELISETMAGIPGFELSLSETHHTAKLDKPSGTAIAVADILLKSHIDKKGWTLNTDAPGDNLPVHAFREGSVTGIHEIIYKSAFDHISIKHEALSRRGFAQGAILAAEFLQGKKGVFGMPDLLASLQIKTV